MALILLLQMGSSLYNRFPRLYRRDTFKTQAALVLYLSLLVIGRIFGLSLSLFLPQRQNILYPDTFSVPIGLFQERVFSTRRSCGILFDGFNKLAYRILQRNNHIQMNVILFCPYLQISTIRIIFPDFLKLYFQVTFYSGNQNLPTVACNPDNMILRLIYSISRFI